jgi:hypothetical protein
VFESDLRGRRALLRQIDQLEGVLNLFLLLLRLPQEEIQGGRLQLLRLLLLRLAAFFIISILYFGEVDEGRAVVLQPPRPR